MASPDFLSVAPINQSSKAEPTPEPLGLDYFRHTPEGLKQYRQTEWRLTPENIKAIREREWCLGEAVGRGEITDPNFQTPTGRRRIAINEQVSSEYSRVLHERFVNNYGAFEAAWQAMKQKQWGPAQPMDNTPRQLRLLPDPFLPS